MGWLTAPPPFSGCSLTKSATQSIADVTFTPVTFDGEAYDTAGFHDNSTNNSRITVPTASYYHLGGAIHWAPTVNTTGFIATLYKNGVEVVSARMRIGAVPSGADTVLRVSQDLLLAAGDYVELVARNSATGGAAINVTADCVFQCHRI